MYRKILGCAIFVLFAGIAGMQPVAAKEPAPSADKGKPDAIREDIKRALDEPTSMEFVDTSLSDVIEYLKDLHKQKHPNFEMVLDNKTLNDLGIMPETTVTKNLKGISLRAALRLLLRDLGMTYIIRDDVLLITSPEEACYTKVYDVADLVSAKEGEKNSAIDSLMSMVAKICPNYVPSGPGKEGWPGWIGSLQSAEVTAVVVHQPEQYQEDVADLLAQLRAVRHSK
jgi:hypothetical protein